MSLRKRLETVLEAALSQAEDPQERIRALVRELRDRQVAGRRALGMTIALEKRLLDELCAAEDATQAADRQARDALQRGDESGAQQSAGRVLELRRKEQAARQAWQDQRAAADKVQRAVAEASKRTQEVAHAHTILLARAHCAEAAKAIAETLQLLESPAIRVALGRAQGKAEEQERAAMQAASG
jgi:phage shock protein A